jgi:hypothetical protein
MASFRAILSGLPSHFASEEAQRHRLTCFLVGFTRWNGISMIGSSAFTNSSDSSVSKAALWRFQQWSG